MAKKPKTTPSEATLSEATETFNNPEDTNTTMNDYSDETPAPAQPVATQTLVIAGFSFTVKAPYTEGHFLTAGEAKALNQTLAENLRNNFAKKVKELKGDRATLSDDEKAGLDEELAAYEATYSFDKVRATTPRTTFVDPVEREAFKSAAALVEASLNARGIAKKALKPENFKALVTGVLEKRPEIREAARRHVEALNAVAHDAIAGLADAELDFKDSGEADEAELSDLAFAD